MRLVATDFANASHHAQHAVRLHRLHLAYSRLSVPQCASLTREGHSDSALPVNYTNCNLQTTELTNCNLQNSNSQNSREGTA